MPVYDPSDPEQVAMVESVMHLREDEERDAISKVISTYQGRHLFWMLLQRAGINESPFAGEETHTTAYNLGRKDTAEAWDKLLLTIGPQAHSVMHTEAITRERRYAHVAGFEREEE